jgi:outer membrane lipoprotein-sorting protein
MSTLVLALFFLLPPPQVPRLSPHDLLSAVSDKYGRLNSLSADFEQISKDANRTTRVRGHVYLKKGRKARFDYLNPVLQSDYFDGKTHTRYLPEDEQATSKPMGKSEDERLLIILNFGNRESPWKDEFDKKEIGTVPPLVPGNQVLILTPNNTTNILDVLVEVDPATLLMHRFGFTRADKTYTEYIFRTINTDPLPDSLFEFKAPPGVKIFVR